MIIASDIFQKWMPQDLSDDRPTLVLLMVWCHHVKAITWTNVDQVPWRHTTSLGTDGLKYFWISTTRAIFAACISERDQMNIHILWTL